MHSVHICRIFLIHVLVKIINSKIFQCLQNIMNNVKKEFYFFWDKQSFTNDKVKTTIGMSNHDTSNKIFFWQIII